MRVRVVFSLKNKGAFVPFHHQNLLSQFIKSLIQTGGDEFKTYQYYNFSGLKGQTKISKSGLHFYSSRVTLVISAQEITFIDFLLNQIFSYRQVKIGDLELEPELVEKELQPDFEEGVKYVCISPLVLANPLVEPQNQNSKRFISPETDEFSDLLYENTMLRMEKSGAFSAEQTASFYEFQIVPDKNYLEKIKQDEKKFARIYSALEQNKCYELRGYTFPFTLYAKKEVQSFVFECGLGVFTHKGFGMLDLANQDPVQRTVVYQPQTNITNY